MNLWRLTRDQLFRRVYLADKTGRILGPWDHTDKVGTNRKYAAICSFDVCRYLTFLNMKYDVKKVNGIWETSPKSELGGTITFSNLKYNEFLITVIKSIFSRIFHWTLQIIGIILLLIIVGGFLYLEIFRGE